MSTDLRFTIEIDGIQKTITSIADANKVIKDLTKNFVILSQAGKDVTKTLTDINQATQVKQNLLAVSKGAVQMQQGMQGAQTASANASMALLNLNYVIRDSPYFFNNFALGVLAVGNNLNPLIDSFNRLRAEAGEKSISTFALLKKALVGGAGISIAFSLVVTAIQSFVFWQAKAGKETEKTTDEIKKQLDALKEMSRSELMKSQVMAMMQLSTIDSEASIEREKYLKSGTQTGLGGRTGTPPPISQFYTDAQREQIKNLNQIIQQTRWLLDNRGLLASIEAEIAKLKKDQDNTKDPALIKDIEKQITGLQDYAKSLRGITKEAKEQKVVLRELGAAYDNMYAKQMGGLESNDTVLSSMRSSFQNRQSSMQDKYGGRVDDLRPVPKKTGIEYIFNDIESEMSKLNTISNVLGDSLISAFTKGKFVLDEFIASLGLAIAKMLILKIIDTALFGGIPVASTTGGALPRVGNPSLGKSSHSTVNVQGKITTNKNKFVVDIENARDSYNNNAKLVTIGRD